MITNIGKSILAKYLIGQAPAYASYIAVGCGPRALFSEGPGFSEEQLLEYSNKKALDFEMFRVPIISRGYVNEDGGVRLVLTAELPTEERYEFTEVGLFSAGFNPSAASFDSKAIYSFTQAEGWEYHTSDGVKEIPSVYVPLDSDNDNVISGEYLINGVMTETSVFHTNADNRTFTNADRVSRNERCRFLNNMTAIRGDDCEISESSGTYTIDSGNHIHVKNASFNFNKNSPADEIKLAFSVINKDGENEEDIPDNVKVVIQFSNSDTSSSGESATFAVDIDDENFSAGTSSTKEDFSENRYIVVTRQLQQLRSTAGFNWDDVSVVKIYVSVTKDSEPSDKFYVLLDAMRFENVTTNNPLYGLTGYSVIKNDGALSIVKAPNTSNFIEFRLAIGAE
jgi:hypothetical protein